MKQLLGEAALLYAHATGAQLYFHGEAVDLALATQELLRADPGALTCELVVESAPAPAASLWSLSLVNGLGGGAVLPQGVVSCPRFYEQRPRTAPASPEGPPSITCPRCGATSYNLNDVRERYCARCHVFIDDLEEGRAST